MSSTKMLLLEYLDKSARQLHVQFTLEYTSFPNNAPSPLQLAKVDGIAPAGIDDLIGKVRSQVSHADVRRSSLHPGVLHIIDLAAMPKNYVMDRTIDITYSGLLADLPDAVGKLTGGAIESRRTFMANEIFNDWATEVKIDVRKETVRDILTNYVPFASYGSFLWTASTWYRNASPETLVQYYGSRSI